jgi:hypothetical protein
MSIALVYAEPMSVWQSMLLTIVLSVAMFALVGVGGYVFVRILIRVLNSYQSSWESSAIPLGLTVDKKGGGIYKPLVGERDGSRISVTHFSINPRTSGGVLQVDHCAQAEVMLRKPLGFLLNVSRRETLLEKAVAQLVDESDQAGHQLFDQIFKIECSDLSSLRSLLAAEFTEPGSPTLLNDLLLAAKKYHRVVLTDQSISLGAEAYFGEAELIEPVVASAVYLAGRVDAAAARLAA